MPRDLHFILELTSASNHGAHLVAFRAGQEVQILGAFEADLDGLHSIVRSLHPDDSANVQAGGRSSSFRHVNLCAVSPEIVSNGNRYGADNPISTEHVNTGGTSNEIPESAKCCS